MRDGQCSALGAPEAEHGLAVGRGPRLRLVVREAGVNPRKAGEGSHVHGQVLPGLGLVLEELVAIPFYTVALRVSGVDLEGSHVPGSSNTVDTAHRGLDQDAVLVVARVDEVLAVARRPVRASERQDGLFLPTLLGRPGPATDGIGWLALGWTSSVNLDVAT